VGSEVRRQTSCVAVDESDTEIFGVPAVSEKPILTTKECEKCGHVFIRYLAYGNTGERKREQKICPVCEMPRFTVEVKHPGEKL